MLELQHADTIERVPAPFRFVQSRWCCKAHHYLAVGSWLQQHGIQDAVPRWQRLALELHETREPHAYQLQALEAWKQAMGRGSLILPIFGAKTLLSVWAIHTIGSSTVILVPTMQLLAQWYALLTRAFHMEIGLYYSGKQCVRSLTLTLYDAARDLMAEHGNTFEMLICDEIQHVSIQTLREAVCMTPAPFRLGLTGTSLEE